LIENDLPDHDKLFEELKTLLELNGKLYIVEPKVYG